MSLGSAVPEHLHPRTGFGRSPEAPVQTVNCCVTILLLSRFCIRWHVNVGVCVIPLKWRVKSRTSVFTWRCTRCWNADPMSGRKRNEKEEPLRPRKGIFRRGVFMSHTPNPLHRQIQTLLERISWLLLKSSEDLQLSSRSVIHS